MKRQERLKLRRRRRTRRILQVLVVMVLLGGLVLGALNFDAVKGWAAKHYLRMRFQPAVIAPEDNPDLFAELSKWHNPEENLNLLLIGIDRGSVPGEEGYTRSDGPERRQPVYPP